MGTQLVMYEEEFTKINAVCDRLTKDANAKVVFLVDKNGSSSPPRVRRRTSTPRHWPR